MNTDQPKPTTVECTCDESASDVIIDQYCPQHSSLKPTTGEWTGDTVRRLEFDNSDRRYDAIAAAHNAALAAVIAESASGLTEQKLANQLAAERIKHDNTCKWYQDQLSAEREKVEFQDSVIKQRTEALHRFQEQLAGERENTDLWKRQSAFESEHREKYRLQVQTLVDALKELLITPASQRDAIIHAALAKVKEGKS